MASSSRCQIAGGSLRYNPLVCELSRQALPCRCRAEWARINAVASRARRRTCGGEARPSCHVVFPAFAGGWSRGVAASVCGVRVACHVPGCTSRRTWRHACCVHVFVGGCCQENRGRMCVRSHTAPRHTRPHAVSRQKVLQDANWAHMRQDIPPAV